ncbi:MAG: glycosyltransferase [Nitrososphaerales archaeon]
MKRVYFPIFGSGLGHAARMVTLASRLVALGFEAAFSSYYEAADYVEQKGFLCFRVPRLDVGWTASGKFEGLLKTSKRLPWHIATFIRQTVIERKIMQSWKPDLVISDSRLSAVIAAKTLGLRCFVVTNQLRILLPPKKRSKRTRPIERFLNEILGKLWNLADRIFFPDLPPPYTISEENLWWVSAVRKKAEYIGFLVQPTKKSREELEESLRKTGLNIDKPIVFIHISGPAFTKPALLRKLLKAATLLKDFQVVISEGRTKGSTEVKRLDSIYYFEWCPISEDLMQISDILVVRGGHSTLGSALLLGKPMLIIPIADHSEQFSNTFKMVRLGVALWLDPLESNPEDICEAVHTLHGDGAYRSRVSVLSQLASKYDGLSRFTDAVLESLR